MSSCKVEPIYRCIARAIDERSRDRSHRRFMPTRLPTFSITAFWTRHRCSPMCQHDYSPGIWRIRRCCGTKVSPETLLFKSVLGFLRTYAYLIRHLSDFDHARDCRLIPASCLWASFAYFIPYFDCPASFDVTLTPCFIYTPDPAKMDFTVLLQLKHCPSRWYYRKTR